MGGRAQALFRAYVAAKQDQQALDYDDLLLYWAEMMAIPASRPMWGALDHVLVDEYQDTNRLQSAILLAMKPDGRGLTVVGDDAQSIYSFRAATVRNILDFPTQFPKPARVVTLDRNYRSTQPILNASNAVIGLAAERYARISGPTGNPRSCPKWSMSATRPGRRAGLPTRCWRSASGRHAQIAGGAVPFGQP